MPEETSLSVETMPEQQMPSPEVVQEPQDPEPKSLEEEHPHLGQTDIDAAVADNPVPPEGADREQKITALNESAKKLVFDDKDPQKRNVYAARVQEKMSKFTENDEKRKTPIVDLIHKKSGKDGDAPNQEQMKTAIDKYGDALDEYVEQQIDGRELTIDLLKDEFGFEDFSDDELALIGENPSQDELKKLVRESVKFEDFSTFLYEKMVEKKVEEAIESAIDSDSSVSIDLEELNGLEPEEKKSRLRSALDKLGSEAEYQFFENKQNNLDTFLDAFFDVGWRDRSGYGEYGRLDKKEEEKGSQIGAETMKKALGESSESAESLISLQKAVISELGAEGPFAADYKKVLTMTDEEFKAYIKGDGAEAWFQAFNGSQKGKALGRLSAWVSGVHGDSEYRVSKSKLDSNRKVALQKNLPKEGNFGMTQEALAYLFTR